MVTPVVADAAAQVPLLVEVNVKMTIPASLSAPLNVYEVASAPLFPNAPLPPELHKPLLVPPVTVPVSATAFWMEQTTELAITATVGCCEILIITVSSLLGHTLLFNDDKVNMTVPAL